MYRPLRSSLRSWTWSNAYESSRSPLRRESAIFIPFPVTRFIGTPHDLSIQHDRRFRDHVRLQLEESMQSAVDSSLTAAATLECTRRHQNPGFANARRTGLQRNRNWRTPPQQPLTPSRSRPQPRPRPRQLHYPQITRSRRLPDHQPPVNIASSLSCPALNRSGPHDWRARGTRGDNTRSCGWFHVERIMRRFTCGPHWRFWSGSHNLVLEGTRQGGHTTRQAAIDALSVPAKHGWCIGRDPVTKNPRISRRRTGCPSAFELVLQPHDSCPARNDTRSVGSRHCMHSS